MVEEEIKPRKKITILGVTLNQRLMYISNDGFARDKSIKAVLTLKKLRNLHPGKMRQLYKARLALKVDYGAVIESQGASTIALSQFH